MSAVLGNLAYMTSATTGTGTLTLGSAVSGYLTFALAGITNGQVVSYAIEDGTSREVGRGTYTSSGTTLSRAPLWSTNSNAAINCSGAQKVFVTALAEDIINSPVASTGRLTLTTGVPVLSSDVAGASTIYFTPYNGSFVLIYDGSTFGALQFPELSQATTDTTKSPAAATTNSNYDMFVWNDGGTIRCTRGPAWSSDTARGAGAGTTELQRLFGVLTNKNAITNGPAANKGTYVGTIRTNGSSTVDMIFGGGSGTAGGQSNVLGVWNYYNAVTTIANNFDNTNTWTYTTATFEAKDVGSAANKISFVTGQDGVSIEAWNVVGSANSSANTARTAAIGYDSTSAMDAACGAVPVAAAAAAAKAMHTVFLRKVTTQGFHYVCPLEHSAATGTCTWYGDNGADGITQAMFSLSLEM